MWVTELQVAPNFRRYLLATDSCLPSQFFCVKMVIYFTLVCPAGVLLSLCSPGKSCRTRSQSAVNECTAAPGLHRWGTTGMTAHITNIISRLPQNQCPPPEAVRWAQRAWKSCHVEHCSAAQHEEYFFLITRRDLAKFWLMNHLEIN